MHTYFDRGGLIPSFGLSAKRMELPLEKLLEESPRFGGVRGADFNERNNIVAHDDSANCIKTAQARSPRVRDMKVAIRRFLFCDHYLCV